MSKIIDYEIAFNPTTRKGNIHFRQEGGKPVTLKDLPADEFTAIAAILSHPHSYGSGQWIHTGVQNIGDRASEGLFQTSETDD